MGELFRRRQAELMAMPPEKRPATDAQKTYLCRLILAEEGDVDEEWLRSLTFAEASAELDKRTGKAPT